MKWLQAWREKRRQRDRALFSYNDGTRIRRADPAILWRDLLNHPKLDLETSMTLAESGEEPQASEVAEALSDVFQVSQWNSQTDTGLTRWELFDLVHQFDEYLSALKKNTSTSRMPYQLLVYGRRDGTKAQATADNNTKSESASFSTPPESNSGENSPPSEPSPVAS